PKPTPRTSRGVSSAEATHGASQSRSQTLVRRATKKPAAPQKVVRRPKPGRHMDIAQSSSVAKFAKHPQTAPATNVKAVTAPAPKAAPVATKPTHKPSSASVPKVASASIVKPVGAAGRAVAAKPVAKPAAKPAAATQDRPAQPHPVAKRALARVTAKKKPAAPAPVSAKAVKDEEINKALSTPKATSTKKKFKLSKAWRRILIIGGSIIAVTLVALAVWNFIPSISVNIAASQAGIEASYPEYTPDGYSLSQPVTYSDGQVVLKFNSHSNDNYYTITQTRSSWDSTAVLDNIVTPEAGANYVTTKEHGLTIYTYDSSAVWVSGGILYQIDSEAPLSNEQIRKIATSL
ncbi:hypothetical protein B7Z17_04815, partial [Candidatus Saccharibacteria bacterium 32-49-10]